MNAQTTDSADNKVYFTYNLGPVIKFTGAATRHTKSKSPSGELQNVELRCESPFVLNEIRAMSSLDHYTVSFLYNGYEFTTHVGNSQQFIDWFDKVQLGKLQ